MYELVDFAIGRLVQTIIAVDGIPSKVLNIDYDRNMKYTNLGEQEMKRISLDSPLIDLTPLKVGYVNFKRGASYLVRKAARRWKQGLDTQGIIVTGADYRVGDYTDSKPFLDCLKGEYPPLAEALFTAKLEEKTIAFDRRWAVGWTGTLYYRGKAVGNTHDGLHLNDVYKYLKELLEEVS